MLKQEESRRRRCTPRVIAFLLIGFGVFFVVLGLFWGIGMPAIMESAVKNSVLTCDASDAAKEKYYDKYGDCDDCAPDYLSFYMFNATNAEAYVTTNAKLQVTEVGPYVYRRREIKIDISFDDNHRVSYKKYTYHTYESSMSCSGCSDSDKVTSYDVGYLSIISAAGGETQFLYALAAGSFGAKWNATTILTSIATYGEQMMRWINGLNSLYPSAMKTVSNSSAVLSFLVGGPSVIAEMDLSGFEYNGLFVTRTISQWALGYPSLLAGLGLGFNYVNVCEAGMNTKCSSCSGTACYDIYADCNKCTKGAAVVAYNNYTCSIIQEIYAAEYGATEAAAFIAQTCGMCSTLGLCAAPLPGALETSGLDYSSAAPDASTLMTYTQRTGCDDADYTGVYEEYNGYTETAAWATLDSRRNPTLAEILAFADYGNCANPTSNLTCSKVSGSDGTQIMPGGVSIKGFKKTISRSEIDVYLYDAYEQIELLNLDESFEYKDVLLHKFSVSNSLLSSSSSNADMGTGYPVDGVQPLAFISGFLAYLSFPVFVYGDETLTSNLQITMSDGVVASNDNLYESGSLKSTYADKYTTVVGIEAGLGKTLYARQRLQANYAVAYSSFNTSIAMTDIVWPNLKPEIIVPIYWADESQTIQDESISSYKTVVTILNTFIPILVIGLILGVGLIAGGVYYLRRFGQKPTYRGPALSVI